ncbi:hypothetical protein B4589_010770 [Halolamina sp. CBA1230]|uniref:DUF7096 domain-containing protein n=1 Tax=Halolamina sp. CBA1230 TaxID=1853690 RepID=UPI0009A17064|nr:hypothetical protein [Halolamina sp. CBA1230]QKY20837.1 hypothetical protein B4589_010770 [Halolamina sp. CBA1230]
MRSLALLAALALSLALVAPAGVGAVGAPADTATDSPRNYDAETPATAPQVDGPANGSNQTRVLVVPDSAVQRTAIDGATLNLGPAAEFNGNISAVEVETASIVAYIQAAEGDSERSRRIIEASSTVETEIITLRDRQQAAITAFNDGELTPEAFVVELATIAAKADALERRMGRLTDLAEEVDGFSLSRPTEIQYELRTFGGPVRERAVDAIRGIDGPTKFFVTTGPEGYELTTVDNGSYYREAYRGAEYSGNADATMGPDEASDVVERSYPKIFRLGDASATTSGTTNIVTVTAPGRSLTAFVDSGEEAVFKEYQRFALDQYESDAVASNTINGINVTVNRTYPGGPLRISVTDAESGDPIDLSITLSQGQAERTAVGRTGDDGTLWTISPRGSYTALAVGDEATAAYVETNSTDPPALAA